MLAACHHRMTLKSSKGDPVPRQPCVPEIEMYRPVLTAVRTMAYDLWAMTALMMMMMSALVACRGIAYSALLWTLESSLFRRLFHHRQHLSSHRPFRRHHMSNTWHTMWQA